MPSSSYWGASGSRFAAAVSVVLVFRYLDAIFDCTPNSRQVKSEAR
jgi:hypothetical protein